MKMLLILSFVFPIICYSSTSEELCAKAQAVYSKAYMAKKKVEANLDKAYNTFGKAKIINADVTKSKVYKEMVKAEEAERTAVLYMKKATAERKKYCK